MTSNNNPMTGKTLEQLRPLIKQQPQPIIDLCISMVEQAVSPSQWDQIVYDNNVNDEAIVILTDNGFYQDIAEQALDGVDIDQLINEAIQRMDLSNK